MAKLPRVPDAARLRDVAPSVETLSGVRLHRIYERGGRYPTLWNAFRQVGPVSRFDHHVRRGDERPTYQDRGILYAAADMPTAFAEYFQRNRRINRALHQPWLVSFALSGELRLLNLTDTFCVRIGASAKLVSGPFLHAQNWSRGFYEAYPEIQGLYYRSSLTNRPTVALYERANRLGVFPSNPLLHRALADPTLHNALLAVGEEIGYGLI